MESRKVLLVVTGGVATYKAAELAGLLISADLQVNVVMSQNACDYVTPQTFYEITQNPVSKEELLNAEQPDVIVAAPATESFIDCLLKGRAEDLLTKTVLSAKVPVIIAPAIKHSDYIKNEFLQVVKALKNQGYIVVEPLGRHSDRGLMGRLAPPKQIAEVVRMFVKEKNLAGKRFLIINKSGSDKFCLSLARDARDRGAFVTISGALQSSVPVFGIRIAEQGTESGIRSDFTVCVTDEGNTDTASDYITIIYGKTASELIFSDGSSAMFPTKRLDILLSKIMERSK